MEIGQLHVIQKQIHYMNGISIKCYMEKKAVTKVYNLKRLTSSSLDPYDLEIYFHGGC